MCGRHLAKEGASGANGRLGGVKVGQVKLRKWAGRAEKVGQVKLRKWAMRGVKSGEGAVRSGNTS